MLPSHEEIALAEMKERALLRLAAATGIPVETLRYVRDNGITADQLNANQSRTPELTK